MAENESCPCPNPGVKVSWVRAEKGLRIKEGMTTAIKSMLQSVFRCSGGQVKACESICEQGKHCRFDVRKVLCSGCLPRFLSKRELYTVTAELLRKSAPEAACVTTAVYVCKPFLQPFLQL